MMNNQFFGNYSNQQPSRSSLKVVSVPVHFISSEQPRTTLSKLKDSAAVKIQRAFRGFLVRKSVKKIVSIRNEVAEIERRIEDIEVVNLIRRDAKERLKVNETLMSLLLKLDSIRGVDSGVRDLRKAVTRKAIALQEKVDSIAQIDHGTLDSHNNDSGKIDSEKVTETTSNSGNFESEKEVVKEIVENCDPVKIADRCGVQEGETTENEREHSMNNGNRELLEKLMIDNEKMMKLMLQISERNEMQTRMINSLSRRVEQLEKAFMTDKLRRKKKTNVALRRRDKDSFCI